jgi:hypothetical protein
MSIYTIIFATLSAFGMFVKRQFEVAFLAVSLLFLLIFMGTRYYVGCDFTGYLNRYENISPYASAFEAFGKAEPGFSLIEILVKTSGLSFVWLIFFATLIIIGCYWVFLRAIQHPLIVLALLFPIMMTQLGMSGVRQGIAVGFLAVAATSFMDGRRWMTALWILVGAQFHLSVAIFLPIAFLAGRQVNVKMMIAAGVLLSPLAILVIGDRFDTYQDRYIEQIYGDQSSAGAGYRYILNLLPAAIFIYFREHVRLRFPKEFPLLYLFAIGTLFLAPLVVLSSFALHRLNFYVMPFTIMMAVYLIYCLPTQRDRMLGLLIPIGAYGGYTLFWQQFSKHYQLCYSVYQSYLGL